MGWWIYDLYDELMIECFNQQVVVIDAAANLAADYQSEVLFFRDCNMASIHVVYQGVNATTGIFVVHGGLSPTPSDMDDNDIDYSDFTVPKAAGSHLWEYTALTWKYGQLRWKANSVSAGTAKILACGKKF